MDRTDLARRIYDAAHLTGTFTLRSGVVSNEYFDKYRFESDPELLADIAAASRRARPDRHRRARRARARRRTARDDDLAGHRAARRLRAQAGQDLRHVPARRGRRDRRAAAVHHRRRRDVGRRDPRRGRRASRTRGAELGPVICVIDRESGGARSSRSKSSSSLALFTMTRAERGGCSGSVTLALLRGSPRVVVELLLASARSASRAGSRRTCLSSPSVTQRACVGVVPGVARARDSSSARVVAGRRATGERDARATHPSTVDRPSPAHAAERTRSTATDRHVASARLAAMQCPNCGYDNSRRQPVLRALRHRHRRAAPRPTPRRRPTTAPRAAAAAVRRAAAAAPPPSPWGAPPAPRRRGPPPAAPPAGRTATAAGRAARRAAEPVRAARRRYAPPAARYPPPGAYGAVPAAVPAVRLLRRRRRRTAWRSRRWSWASWAGCSAASARSSPIVFGFVARGQIQASQGRQARRRHGQGRDHPGLRRRSALIVAVHRARRARRARAAA